MASYWYSTVRRYNYFKDVRLLHTNVNAGHFTQMVWLKTKYFGIGKATSQTGKIFVVAFYYPPGKLQICMFALRFFSFWLVKRSISSYLIEEKYYYLECRTNCIKLCVYICHTDSAYIFSERSQMSRAFDVYLSYSLLK